MAYNSFSQKKKKNQIFILLAQTKSCSWFPPKTQSQLPYFSMNYKHVVIFFFPCEVEQQ